jgi:hypothetical protein
MSKSVIHQRRFNLIMIHNFQNYFINHLNKRTLKTCVFDPQREMQEHTTHPEFFSFKFCISYWFLFDVFMDVLIFHND